MKEGLCYQVLHNPWHKYEQWWNENLHIWWIILLKVFVFVFTDN